MLLFVMLVSGILKHACFMSYEVSRGICMRIHKVWGKRKRYLMKGKKNVHVNMPPRSSKRGGD